MKPNRLGWITSLSVNPEVINVTAFGDSSPNYISNGIVRFSIDGVAENPGALFEQFQEWMNSGIQKPVYQKEYMCLYCGSPNKIEHTHCKKCGAPRSFVIG